MESAVNRRTLFAGAGLAGAGLVGVTTLAGGGWALAEEGSNDGVSGGVPLSTTLPMALTPTAGLSYLGLSGYTMQSRTGANAVTDVVPLGAGPKPGAATVNHDIAIPHGAVITELYVSGSAGITVFLQRQIYGVYLHDTIASVTLPSGSGLQEKKVSLSPPFTHDASTGTFLFRAELTPGAAISSVVIGYKPLTLSFVPLSPTRCFDTRPNVIPGVKGKVAQGEERTVDTTVNATGVPANAKAVVGNVTVSGTTGAFGWVDLRPSGTGYNNTSTVNFTGPGQTVANAFTAACGPDAKLTARCDGQPGVSTDIIIDIVGYYI